VIAETEERRHVREVVASEPAGTVDREHLDEISATELNESIRRPHAVVVEGARRQRKACLLELSGGPIEIVNGQYDVIDGTSGCHVRLFTPLSAAPERPS
jgi:hypothetical protein